MGSFLYLYKMTLKNRAIKALKRPVTYIFVVFAVFYVVMICGSLGVLIKTTNVDNPQSIAVLLSILVFFNLPANIISYSKRRGLLFRPSEIHFVFPAPVSPKGILLFTGIKNLAVNFLIAILIAVMGSIYFSVSPLIMILYALVFIVCENVLESSMMVLCYGNEVLPEKFFKWLTVAMYVLISVFVLIAVALMLREGSASFAILEQYLSQPVIQLIPVIGWNIALIRLFFIGPTVLNVICTILFIITAIALLLLAYRMKCEGAYFEDAAKFADDYQELKVNRQKGVMSSLGKKKKFKQANVEYKGFYAKAIFYRQLLEYKKSRFFIFGFNTLLNLGLGVLVAVLGIFTDMISEVGMYKVFILPGITAYMVFIFSGYATKWSRELENPYTYLIPDRCMKKLWYATKMEHIRSLVDGLLITLPGAIVMGLTPLQTLLTVVLYICLTANRLYFFMAADAILGTTLGTTVRSLLKMLMQGIAIGIGAMGAVLGGIFLGVEAGFAIMIVLTLLLTFLGALIAGNMFEKMEALG